MRIAVACGGTGGHVIPGLVTAQELRARGHHVEVLLGGHAAESTSIAGWDGPVHSVPAAGISHGFSLKTVCGGLKAFSSAWRCRIRMRPLALDALLGMGGYASVGPVVAARTLRIPVVLHEANAVPGAAVSRLAPLAAAVALNFAETRSLLRHPRTVVTGFPLRPQLLTPSSGLEGMGRGFRLMAMGGSQGAQALDDAVSQAVCALARGGTSPQIVHLTRPESVDEIKSRYRSAGVTHRVYGYLKEIWLAYQSADVAVCRAGAATCAELAACGVPALLVPYPHARRDHQLANARALSKSGGVEVLEQRDLTVDKLCAFFEECMRDHEKLAGMRAGLATAAVRDGAARLAELVEEVAGDPAARTTTE